MSTHRIDLPYTELPVTLTEQGNVATVTTDVQDAAGSVPADLPMTMRLHWEPVTAGVRDTIAARCTSTVCADALRAAGLDVTARPPQIVPYSERVALWLEITIDDEETPAP